MQTTDDQILTKEQEYKRHLEEIKKLSDLTFFEAMNRKKLVNLMVAIHTKAAAVLKVES